MCLYLAELPKSADSSLSLAFLLFVYKLSLFHFFLKFPSGTLIFQLEVLLELPSSLFSQCFLLMSLEISFLLYPLGHTFGSQQ